MPKGSKKQTVAPKYDPKKSFSEEWLDKTYTGAVVKMITGGKKK